MAKNTYKIILLALFVAGCGKTAPQQDIPDPKEPTQAVIHTVLDMNEEQSVLNSHVGDELSSTLQPVYEYFQTLPNDWLLNGIDPEKYPDQRFANYPRLKRMSDGRFIMFYHGGKYGTRIWATTSDDLKVWSTPVMLFTAEKVWVDVGGGKTESDNRRYVNPDAVVLPNGDLLLVASYRAASHYNAGLDCGLVFKRSTDNGRTWSSNMHVPVGPNWEPYLLLLPDGTIQCFYTDAIPITRNSGTAMIVSKDNGKTFELSSKKRVCTQFKYVFNSTIADRKQYNGQNIFTDQMPCMRILNDGKTIVGWLEARLENPIPSDCGDSDSYHSYCMMSLVRNHSLDWEDLSYDNRAGGPSDRESNVCRGGSGYIATFPSGEVVLSFNIDSKFSLIMGDATATKWHCRWTDKDNYIRPLDKLGYWGSIERIGPKLLTVAMHGQNKSSEDDQTIYHGIQFGLMYLNHRVQAERETISVDGNANEWKTRQALYVGAKTGEDAIVRFARDEANLYIAVECRDSSEDPSTMVSVRLSKDMHTSVNLVANGKGLYSSNISSARSVSLKSATASGQSGWICEISVPLADLSAKQGDTLMCGMYIQAQGVKYTVTRQNQADITTWQKVML